MNIPITNPVTYNVTNVDISQIGVNVHGDGLSLNLSYRWLAADGTVLRTGSNQYSEGEMETLFNAKGGSFVPFAAAFKSLYPVGKSPAMWMEVSNEGVLKVTTGIGIDCPDGICRFTPTVVPDETLTATLAANGLNQAAVIGALTQMVQGVLAA